MAVVTKRERRVWVFLAVMILWVFGFVTYELSGGLSHYLLWSSAVGLACSLGLLLLALVASRRHRDFASRMTALPPNCRFTDGPLEGRSLYVAEERLRRGRGRIRVAVTGRLLPLPYRVRRQEGAEVPYSAARTHLPGLADVIFCGALAALIWLSVR